ncbi:MAG TPA: PKD domain-containing protein [Candidatus Brocadiia bacterium]|nr:PKD domain-containing protein [Candidatus Brocadiia bacterium]
MIRAFNLRALSVAQFITIALLCPAMICRGDDSPWWNPDWQYRKTLNIERRHQIVSCVLNVSDKARSDGGDIRVADAEGKSVKSKCLFRRSDGYCIIVFDTTGAKEPFHVYFGNAHAGRPEEWDVPVGLVLEVRELGAAGYRSLTEARAAFDASRRIMGVGFAPRVYQIFNPFGPNSDFIARYKGYATLPKDGRYTFALVADDAAYLLVDGKLVAQQPPGQTPEQGRRYRFTGSANLSGGPHLFECVHATKGGPICYVAVQQPGQERFDIMPPSVFGMPGEAGAAEIRKRASALVGDMEFRTTGMLDYDGAIFVGVRFRAMSSPGQPAEAWWAFGDGTTATGPEPTHVYAAPGKYNLRLTIKTDLGRLTETAQDILVEPAWEDFNSGLDRSKEYADIIEKYDFTAMNAAGLANSARLLKELGRDKALLNCSLGLEKRAAELKPEQRLECLLNIGKLLCRFGGDPDQALERYRRALAEFTNPEQVVEIRYGMADVLFHYAKRYGEALTIYESIPREFEGLKTWHVRAALTRIGDIYRDQAETAKAREAYIKAQAEQYFKRNAPENIGVGGSLFEVEAFFARGDFAAAIEALDRLEWEYPTRRIDGRNMVLRAQCNNKLGNFEEAMKAAQTYLRYADDRNQIPSALLELGDAAAKLEKPDLALKCYEKIANDHQESAEWAEAKRRADELKTLMEIKAKEKEQGGDKEKSPSSPAAAQQTP